MQRWKLTLSYLGTDFSGWQRQEEGVPSVQKAVEDAVFAFCGQKATLHVAGRTDAGVHARGQVAHLDLAPGKSARDGAEIAKALNALLRPLPVAVLRAEEVAPDFHARFHAVNKLYSYTVVCRPAPPVLEAQTALHLRRALDVPAMRKAAARLVGHHDFTSFRARECQARSPEKTLDRLDIESTPCDGFGGERLVFLAEARSFLHHQVRNMVGTLLRVGEGKWSAEEVSEILAAKDRTRAGPTAPPQGLCLERVDYGAPPCPASITSSASSI